MDCLRRQDNYFTARLGATPRARSSLDPCALHKSFRVPCTKALKSTLDAAYRRAAVILTTKTGRSYSKRYLAQQWEKACKPAGIVDLHCRDIRGTTVTMLAEAGCTLPEIVSITGHTPQRAQEGSQGRLPALAVPFKPRRGCGHTCLPRYW